MQRVYIALHLCAFSVQGKNAGKFAAVYNTLYVE